MTSVICRLRESYRGAVEWDDGWPVNSHDACMRLGARFKDVLPLLLDVAEAAEPLSRLPLPVSSDERTDWLTYQQRLHEALAALDAPPGREET